STTSLKHLEERDVDDCSTYVLASAGAVRDACIPKTDSEHRSVTVGGHLSDDDRRQRLGIAAYGPTARGETIELLHLGTKRVALPSGSELLSTGRGRSQGAH